MISFVKILFEVPMVDPPYQLKKDPREFDDNVDAGPSNINPAALGAKAAMKANSGGGGDSNKQEIMRRTFNALPNKGRDLHIAGTGQNRPVRAADQQQFDAMYKKIAAGHAPGVPSNTVTKAAGTQQDITAGQAAGILAKKGAQAVGDAVSSVGHATVSGVRGIAQHIGDHPGPVAGALAVGAAGALGLRKLLNRNKQA